MSHVHEWKPNMHAGMEEWVCACGADKYETAVEDVLAAAVALSRAVHAIDPLDPRTGKVARQAGIALDAAVDRYRPPETP